MKRKLFALVFAAGFTGLALTAWAQAPGHGMHDPLAVLQRIQAKLNLNTSQQQQWDAAVAQSKAAHLAIKANFQQLKTATQAELAKADPGNPELARAVAAVDNQIGDAAAAQGKTAEALSAYGNAFGIIRKLADGRPGDAALQVELAVEFYRISTVSDPIAARAALTSGLAIAETLEREHKLTNAQQALPNLLRSILAKLPGPEK